MKQKLETLQTCVEELTSTNILDFYAGWWVLQQPTQPHGNIRQSLREDVQVRWNKVKKEVQGDLLAEGLIAILSESQHIFEWNIPDDEFFELLDSHGLWVKTEGINKGEVVNRNFVGQFFKEEWLGIMNDVLIPVKSWPETRSKIKSYLSSEFDIFNISLKEFVRFIGEDMFGHGFYEWEEDFGGESWAIITENILKLWGKYPNADFEFIDHVIDLAHNNDIWLDKFVRGRSLLSALDKKFSARSPKEYVDQLSDRKIIAGVKRALPVNSSPMQNN